MWSAEMFYIINKDFRSEQSLDMNVTVSFCATVSCAFMRNYKNVIFCNLLVQTHKVVKGNFNIVSHCSKLISIAMNRCFITTFSKEREY